MQRTQSKTRSEANGESTYKSSLDHPIPVLEMTVGETDDPAGMMVNWSRFTVAEMPIGGIRILIPLVDGDADNKDWEGILDCIDDAKHMIEEYRDPLLKNPEALSEIVTQARERKLHTRVDDAVISTWPKKRQKEAVFIAESLARLLLMKLTRARADEWIRRFLSNRPELIPDIQTVIAWWLKDAELPIRERMARSV